MHIRTRRRFRLLPSARAMEAGTHTRHSQALPNSHLRLTPQGRDGGGQPGWRGCPQHTSRRCHDEDLTSDRTPLGSTCQWKVVNNSLRKLHLAFPLMWDKQPKGKTTHAECQPQGGWRPRTALPLMRRHPVPDGTTDAHRCERGRLTSITPTSPRFSSWSRLPPPHEAPAPRPAEAHTTAPAPPLPNLPSTRGARSWPGPSRHAPPPPLRPSWPAARVGPLRRWVGPLRRWPRPLVSRRWRGEEGAPAAITGDCRCLSPPSVFFTSLFQPLMGSVVLLLPRFLYRADTFFGFKQPRRSN